MCICLHFRREQWPLFSTYSCWQQLVAQTKNLSKDHAALSEVYSTHLVSRLGEVMEDVQRIYRRVNILYNVQTCYAETQVLELYIFLVFCYGEAKFLLFEDVSRISFPIYGERSRCHCHCEAPYKLCCFSCSVLLHNSKGLYSCFCVTYLTLVTCSIMFLKLTTLYAGYSGASPGFGVGEVESLVTLY